jgi:hypothetical protein
MELTKILKDEAWIEGEKRQKPVKLSDPVIFERAVKIWEEGHEKLDQKSDLAVENCEKV